MTSAPACSWIREAKAASISVSLPAFRIGSSTRLPRAAACTSSIQTFGLFGLISRAISLACGTSSKSSSSRLGISSLMRMLKPVRLPPGRARLATRPSATGSAPTEKTIGIVEVGQGAEDAAVQVFAGNLRDLLLAAPAGARPTMGLDPGYRTGAKVAVVTATGQRTRLVNRMKGTLARLGIRHFRPTLRNAAEHLAALSTPEGSPLPPNVAAELERDIARLRLVIGQIKQIEEARRQRLEEQPERGPHTMVRLLARVVGIGIETADMLVNEVLSRPLRDRRAVARYAGLTGAPDESGAKRREQGLAKAGNARVRRGMIQLAWRFLRFQKNSALAQWYQARTADHRGATRKTMIVALARKLLIALWRFVTIGEPLDGVTLRPAS